MNPDQLRSVLRDEKREENRRQTRRALFIVFVVIPVGCVVAVLGVVAVSYLVR